MSSSSESSDCHIVHLIQPPVSLAASGVTDIKDMQPAGVGVVCHMGGASYAMVGGASLPGYQQQHARQQPDSASSSQQFSVEEQLTTVRIPMRRPNAEFLELVQEGGGHGDVFTMSEIIHHMKNYIIQHQLYDKVDPRVVHCRNHRLGQVFGVDLFTINEAVPLFMKHTFPVPDSCIRIRRQLVKKAIESHSVGAASATSMQQESSRVTSTVTSTTEQEVVTSRAGRQDGTTLTGISTDNPTRPGSHQHTQHNAQCEDDGDTLRRGRRTSVNIEYGDEVDGACPMFHINMATDNHTSPVQSSQAPEEDSVSVQYDSDHFAVEYELEDQSESEHSSHGATRDFVVVQKESDVEFWADYSETETNSDTEFGEGDQWQCETCETLNVPFYRNCSKCWAVRPHWLPDSTLPSCSTTTTLPAQSCVPPPPGYSTHSSNDDQPGGSQGQRQWRAGDKGKRRRVRIMSASSSERSSESLVSFSEDEAPSTSAGVKEDSGLSSTPNQEVASSQDLISSSSHSQNAEGGGDARRAGGGKMKRNDVASADVCMVCASRPKTGCIIHGSSGHQVCCYRCAKRLWRKGLPCPVCRKTIQKVIKNFVL